MQGRRCPPGPAAPSPSASDGRKRYLLTETLLGRPLVLLVHAADINDRNGLVQVSRRIRRRFPWLILVFADGGYQGEQAAACAAAQERPRLEIVKRPRAPWVSISCRDPSAAS